MKLVPDRSSVTCIVTVTVCGDTVTSTDFGLKSRLTMLGGVVSEIWHRATPGIARSAVRIGTRRTLHAALLVSSKFFVRRIVGSLLPCGVSRDTAEGGVLDR